MAFAKTTLLQLLAVILLITLVGAVHYGAKQIVGAGFGIGALIVMICALPLLSRYLD